MQQYAYLYRKSGQIMGLVLLWILLVGPLGYVVLAQEGDEVVDRETLLRVTAKQAFIEQISPDQTFEIGLTKIVGEWAFVNFRVYVVEDEAAPNWEVYIGLARWDEETWTVAIEGTAQFLGWLDQTPAGLITHEARLYFDPTSAVAANVPGLWLPFPVGQTWKYLTGPTGGPGWDSVDFGPFRLNEFPRPNPTPTGPLTGSERDVTAAATGVVIDRTANTLVLRHGSAGAWETGYDLLAADSNTKQIGQIVFQGERIGAASSEGSPLPDNRVRFWIRREGTPAPIDGQILSEWQIFRDNSYEVGPGAGRIVYKNGAETVDCETVEKARLAADRCHVHHFSVEPSPLPTATITISPSNTITIPLNTIGATAVSVAGADNLYRIWLRLTYESPISITVVDAFPDTEVVEVAPGTVFHNRPFTIIRNAVDPENGLIEFEATLQAPAPAFSGSGSLVEITWQRRALGQVQVKLDELVLMDLNGRPLPFNQEIKDEALMINAGFALHGQVSLQGRDDWSDIRVNMADQKTQTDAEGRFEMGTAGSYHLTLTTPGYLSAQAEGDLNDLSEAQEMIDLGSITLPGGDVTGDNLIDIFDLALIGSRYGRNDPLADINGDGLVDIFDLALTAANYNRQGPVTDWR